MPIRSSIFVLMRKGLFALLIVCGIVSSLGFMHTSAGYNTNVAAYYDTQLDSLLLQVVAFDSAARQKKPKAALLKHFFACRNCYKNISFFVEQFDVRGARAVNGPDLLRIEDDTQQDSTKPHGLQHIEAMLYRTTINYAALKTETHLLYNNIKQLRDAPDHKYYFRDDRVWEALRSGIYRIVSMGITGFDVPLSLHALPETKIQLESAKHVFSLYKQEVNDKEDALYIETMAAFDKALSFVNQSNDFNTFDRLVFIKDYINPLTEKLKRAAFSIGVVNSGQLTPLNPAADNLFAENIFNIEFFSPNDRYRVTPARVALGKKLFYDTKLSINNSRSCASCHKPALAFTDGLPKGKHIDGVRDVLRNTPTLWNSVFQARQFYDSRALVLETQLSAVVHSAEEMGGSLTDAIPVLTADEYYNKLFKEAYPNEKIMPYTIANAIASYIRTLVSFNSRFDVYMRGGNSALTQNEQNGFNIFMGKGKCGTCHYAPMFNSLVPPRYEESESEILAVPITNAGKSKIDTDEGKYYATKTPLHKYAFKTPTIRNAALTAPYMHNGVFKTLDEVIEFYNKGGGAGVGIKLETQTLPADKLNLTTQEKKDIIAFIQTLTDTVYHYANE